MLGLTWFSAGFGSVLGLVLFVCDLVRFRSVRNKALGSVRGDSFWLVVHFGIRFGFSVG